MSVHYCQNGKSTLDCASVLVTSRHETSECHSLGLGSFLDALQTVRLLLLQTVQCFLQEAEIEKVQFNYCKNIINIQCGYNRLFYMTVSVVQ